MKRSALEDLPTTAVRLLFVVVDRYERREPVTYGPLMAAMGWRSRSTCHRYLTMLERAGLVHREPHTHGTLRPTVRVVATSLRA